MAKAHILVLPYPAQGHMLPLLDLTAQLAGSGILSVTVVVTPKNLPILDPLLARCPSISTLVLPFPDHPSIPPDAENSKDLPSNYFPTIIQALAGLHQPVLSWARAQPSPPSAVLSDVFLPWTSALAADLGVPRVYFTPSGALAIALASCIWRDTPENSTDSPAHPVPFPSVPGGPVFPWAHLNMSYRMCRDSGADPALFERMRTGFLDGLRSWGFVINTFDALEGRYIRHLKSDLATPRLWAVGPVCSFGDVAAERGGRSVGDVLTWLDRFEAGTVLYVCLGSEAGLSEAQSTALAATLESSGVRFLWCATRGEANCIPEGFEGRTEGRGMVVRGWAPQVAVLGHGAVGWFLTHCGWNSVTEAVAAGVAMLTWPITADHFYNAWLMVEEVGVAVTACEGADAVPDPDHLARVLTETVGGDRPERARAAELKEKAMKAVKDGVAHTGTWRL